MLSIADIFLKDPTRAEVHFARLGEWQKGVVMTIITTLHALLSALASSDFAIFDGFKEDALDELEAGFRTLLDYANHVIEQQYAMQFAAFRYEGEEFRTYVQNSDVTRRRLHLAACASINMLNRICKLADVEELFPGVVAGEDSEGRRQAAMAIGTFINELYNLGIGNDDPDRAFDAATYGRDGRQYDPKKITAAIEGLVE